MRVVEKQLSLLHSSRAYRLQRRRARARTHQHACGAHRVRFRAVPHQRRSACEPSAEARCGSSARSLERRRPLGRGRCRGDSRAPAWRRASDFSGTAALRRCSSRCRRSSQMPMVRTVCRGTPSAARTRLCVGGRPPRPCSGVPHLQLRASRRWRRGVEAERRRASSWMVRGTAWWRAWFFVRGRLCLCS